MGDLQILETMMRIKTGKKMQMGLTSRSLTPVPKLPCPILHAAKVPRLAIK